MPNDAAKPGRPDRKQGGGGVVLLVLVMLLLPVLYLASSGPAFWMETNGYISGSVTGFVYAPLLWICDRSPMARDALDQYCELFFGNLDCEKPPK